MIMTSGIPRLATEVENPSPPQLEGTWWYVGGSGSNNYTKIQDAIDNASDGDTVFVFHGTYIGYVIANKAIHILGEDKNTTIIIGYFAYTLSIVTDYVSINGFTIQNNARQGEGVRIDSSYNTFTDNIIDIPDDRIRLYGHNNTISNNIIKNTYLYISNDDNIISGNTFINYYNDSDINDYYGVYLLDCWNNMISNNSFVHSGVFISLENMCNNFVINNLVNGKPLRYHFNESNQILDDESGQIILVNCNNITIKNQEISNTTVGIQLAESNSCLITTNHIIGNRYGICINGQENFVDDNDITNNRYALEISGEHNKVTYNTISHNHFGIYLDDSSDYNTISENTIGNNYNSILLDQGSDFNNLLTNIIEYNKEAIQISGDSNTLSGNTITHNNDSGILLDYCDFNIVSNNSITNNSLGLTITHCDSNNIIKNIVSGNNNNGISLIGDNNSLYLNLINNNTQNGIQVLSGSNNNISVNILTSNDNGISLIKSRNGRITNNNITLNSESGITLNCSYNNMISTNRISQNEKGIKLISSTNNTIITNNFLRNRRHALFENCTNKWDENYWGRPRLLPKLIFGIQNNQDEWLPFFDIDWHPSFRMYEIE